jgi:hypothetical protein
VIRDEFRKACACPGAGAVTGDLRIEPAPDRTPGMVSFDVVFTPGPSCPVCGKAWSHVHYAAPAAGGTGQIGVCYAP